MPTQRIARCLYKINQQSYETLCWAFFRHISPKRKFALLMHLKLFKRAKELCGHIIVIFC
jgi:hypothetical protein